MYGTHSNHVMSVTAICPVNTFLFDVLSKLINFLNLSLAFGHHDTAPTVVDVRLWVLDCLVAIVT